MSLEELQKRVRVLQDKEEIKRIHRFYIFCLANQQFYDMVRCFASDGIAHLDPDGTVQGTEALDKFFEEVMKPRIGPPIPHGGNILIQPVFKVEGDKAAGQWIMNRFSNMDPTKLQRTEDRPEGAPAMRRMPKPGAWRGKYVVEYVRENDKWRFSSLRWFMPWPEREDAA
jgi:hypothetical protein